MSDLLQQIENLVTPILALDQVDLVDLTYQKSQGGWALCFYLDKPGGITLDDCSTWSRKLGDLLDQTELLQQHYSLEVSSPGLNRPLKKLKDFQNYIGENVDIKLFAPMEGQKNFHGVLLGADESTVRLRLDDQRNVTLSRDQIAKANLNPNIKF